jgi:hypothetical protein
MYDQNQYFVGDLFYIAEWFCEKIEYILGYDIFPLPVNGETALELIENANKFDSDSELEFDLWYVVKSRWILNHCWLIARGGSVLPSIFFRRVEDLIEISWDNTFWKEKDINFKFQKGVFRIEFSIFVVMITKFLNSIIFDMKKRISNTTKIKDLERYIGILNK